MERIFSKRLFLPLFAVFSISIFFSRANCSSKANEINTTNSIEKGENKKGENKSVLEIKDPIMNDEVENDIEGEGMKGNSEKKGMNETILVTGGCGYIGSHAVVELLDNGYDVIVIDNFSNCSHDVPNNIKKITNKDFCVYDCDIRDLDSLEQIFKSKKIDAIIHFAGLKSIKESYMNPLEYYDTNVNGSLNILKMMKKYGVKKLIFSSSATVYGKDALPPFKESMNTEFPVHAYGKTKFIIEQMISDMRDINSVILRYFNPIGAHSSGLIGEDPLGIPNNLMPIIVSVCQGRLPKLTVFGNDYNTPDGTCIRDYIHVVDLAKGHIKALSYLKDHEGCNIFNLGTGRGTSVLELINAFERVNNIKVNYEIGARRDGDLPICFASCEKANEELGWKPELTIEDMCKSAWDYAIKTKNAQK